MTRPSQRSNLPKPEKYAEAGSEDAHQISLFMWAALPEVQKLFPDLKWLFAIPNGGLRHKAIAAKLRAMGTKSGVSDIFLPIKRGQWSGLFIELKRPKTADKRRGEASAKQDEWGNHFLSQGFGFKICYGWEDARDTIISYLEWRE